MHGISAHSALAIKRQRRRDRQRHGGKRRDSTPQADHYEGDNRVMGTITMFHVGSVFLLLAAFLMLGAVLTSESRKETAELVGTGVICLIIGLFLIVLNRFYGQKEEDDLANYVESRLGRSRSGQRLYHEQESMPEHLGGVPSTSASMESNISRDMSAKGNKRGKKSKRSGSRGRGDDHNGIEETAVNHGGSDHNKVKVDLVNEHNQYRNHCNDISTANVVLDRIAEEAGGGGGGGMAMGGGDNYHHHNQPISYVNANYDDGSKGSNNLYRVYDRDYSRAGGAV